MFHSAVKDKSQPGVKLNLKSFFQKESCEMKTSQQMINIFLNRMETEMNLLKGWYKYWILLIQAISKNKFPAGKREEKVAARCSKPQTIINNEAAAM